MHILCSIACFERYCVILKLRKKHSQIEQVEGTNAKKIFLDDRAVKNALTKMVVRPSAPWSPSDIINLY